MRLHCSDICLTVLTMGLTVFTLVYNTKAYTLEDYPIKEGSCDLYTQFTSSSNDVIRQYCYKCIGDVTNVDYLKECINQNCNNQQKFEIMENGNSSYYMCWKSCGGPPMACKPLVSFDHGEYICSEDVEQSPTPRKFLVCQTCHAFCFTGYHLKQPATNTCTKRNSTHIGWNTTEILPSCISITQICSTPDISGVTLEGCVTFTDFNSSTNLYSYHQECTARCGPGLYQVYDTNTSCGENGVWSDLHRMEKMCVDPSVGCEMSKPHYGSWNCTGIWFNHTHISSGSLCQLDCGDDLRSYGNSLVCDNTHLSPLYVSLQHPFCYSPEETTDIIVSHVNPLIWIALGLLLPICIGIFIKCLSRTTSDRNGCLLSSVSSHSSSVTMTSNSSQGQPDPSRQNLSQGQPDPSRQNSSQGQPDPSRQNSSQGQPDPSRQNSSQGQPDPSRQDSSQGQPDPSRQNSSQGQPDPSRQDSSQGQTDPSRQNLSQGQPGPSRQDSSQGQPDPSRQDSSQGQPSPRGQNSSQGQPGPSRQDSSQGQPDPSIQDSSQGQPGPSRQDSSQGQPDPSRQDSSQGQPGSSRQDSSQGQPGPSMQDSSQRQPDPSIQDSLQRQPDPSRQDSSQGQRNPSRQDSSQGQPGSNGHYSEPMPPSMPATDGNSLQPLASNFGYDSDLDERLLPSAGRNSLEEAGDRLDLSFHSLDSFGSS